MIKVLYTIFLAVMIALFVGLGISVFYSAGQYPEYPTELNNAKETPAEYTTSQKELQATYDQQVKDYSKKVESVSRTSSIIAIIASIILLVLSLTVLAKIEIINDGVLLGGVLTLAYGIIRGFMSNNNKFQFLTVTVGLIVAFVLGYIKFIKPAKNAK